MAVDERDMRLPSSLRGPFALISTRSGTRLEKTALHTFSLGSKRPRQVFNASPSVQCVAKCRRSQMSIPEAGYPHMAVCLEDRRHAGIIIVYCMIERTMKDNFGIVMYFSFMQYSFRFQESFL